MLRREIYVSKSIGLALFLERNLLFFLVLLCTTGQFPSTSPRAAGGGGGGGAYIWRGDLTEGFLRYESGGLIFGGAYFRNFTVCHGGVTLLAERSRLSQVPAVRFSNRSKIRPVPCELA